MLFEAFDSVHLNKTMKFVKDGKEEFLEMLNSIAEEIDLPLSKIDDSCLKYMSYKNAIKLKVNEEFEDCSNCEGNGTIKRAWGRGFRNVQCTQCKGAGKSLKIREGDMKYFKFWFTKEGKYICTTGVDGKYQPDKNDLSLYEKRVNITEDYKTMSEDELIKKYNLVSGQSKMSMSIEGKESIIGTLYIEAGTYKQHYQINDIFGYNTPDGHNSCGRLDSYRRWSSLGSKALRIKQTIREFNAEVELLGEQRIDDLYWNIDLDIRFRKSPIKRELIKDADFAIVLDFEEQSGKEFKKKTEIEGEREEAKKGATALMSNDDIKRMNIENYINKISNIDLSTGLKGFIGKIPYIFGKNLCLHYIITETNIVEFSNIIESIYAYIKETDEYEKELISQNITSIIKEIYNEGELRNKKIEKRIKIIKVDMNSDEKKFEISNLLNKIEETSKRIYESLLIREITCIEDMEILNFKIKGISNILNDRLSYSIKRILSNPINSYSDSAALSSLFDYIEDTNQSTKDRDLAILEQISKIAER